MRDPRARRRPARILARRYSWRWTESPISQSVGGHSPTKSARRSALPRSASPIVLARIQRPTQSHTEARETRCRCQLRNPIV